MKTLSNLCPQLSEHMGALWFRSGLGEHASAAAFARFVLDIMSIGASPELIKGAAMAISDEVEHARLCFGMARQFTNAARGPGHLDLRDMHSRFTNEEEIIVAAVKEGCVMETLSAREAAVAAARAATPESKAVLRRIAADEFRHAELSWNFVSWALKKYPDSSSVAAQALKDACQEALELVSANRESEIVEQEDHGYLLRSTRQDVYREAIEGLIAGRAAQSFEPPISKRLI